jgi:hypothetical protein
VLVVVRDWFGRRVWSFTRCGAALPPSTAAPAAAAMAWVQPTPVDSLEGIVHQPRTKALLDSWASETAVADIVEHHKLSPAFSLAEVLPPPQEATTLGSGTVTPSEQSQASLVARQVCAALGYASAHVAPLPVDAALIRSLKAIDAMPPREEYDVDVVYVHSNAAPDAGEAPPPEVHSKSAFDAFVAGLGVVDSAWPAARTVALPHLIVRYWPKSMAVDELPGSAEKGGGSGDGKVRTRLLWDALPLKFDWTAVRHAHHALSATISPQLELGRSSNFFDIVIAPLPAVGVYAIRLHIPLQCMRTERSVVDAVQWGAPLMHGCQLTAATLSRIVNIAVENAVFRREQESGAYISCPHPRRVAIAKTAARALAILPSQHLVGYFV